MSASRSPARNGQARPKPFTFYPPKNSHFVTALAKMALGRDIRRKVKVTQIHVDPDALERLRALRGRRCLVTPSHSGSFEPHMLMHLSKLLQDDFNYIAAMELFAHSPLQRWVLQRLGVYSVIRGAVDRPSFAMTRQLLAEGKRWLVIFPEGETVWLNSTVMPFQQGVFQLAFKALQDAAKEEDEPSLYCIPMAIRYFYLRDMHDAIDASLGRLESSLSLPVGSQAGSRYDRLRGVAEAVLAANERTQHVSPAEGSSLNDRIQHLKEHVLSQLERQLSITSQDSQPPLERVRALFNAVDRIVDEAPPASEYERQLAVERQHAARHLYCDLWRALRFVAIYDGYVSERMTVERFLDVLGLLEFEVFQRRRMWGPRKACIQVGDPLDLKDHMAAYQADKRGTAERVTRTLETSVRSMLESLEADCQPLRLKP